MFLLPIIFLKQNICEHWKQIIHVSLLWKFVNLIYEKKLKGALSLEYLFMFEYRRNKENSVLGMLLIS